MFSSANAVVIGTSGTVRILDDDPQVLKFLIHATTTIGFQVEGFREPAAFLGDGSVAPPVAMRTIVVSVPFSAS